MRRVLLAGVLGGIAMFVWNSVAHVVTSLGQAGVKEIPNEQPVLGAMSASMGSDHGLYIFPGMGVPEGAPRQQQQAAVRDYDRKLAANPSGLLIYHPAGMKAFTPSQLITEFAVEMIEALLAVWLLSQATIASFGGKVGFIVVLGILGALVTNVPYWNWYGFPTNYTLVYMLVEIVGFLVVGVVAGLVTKAWRGWTLQRHRTSSTELTADSSTIRSE